MGSIALPALDVRPPAPTESPLTLAGQVLSLRDLMQRGQLQQGQLQQQQMQIAQVKALNEAYATSLTTDANGNPSFDRQNVFKTLAARGQGSAIPDVTQKFMELDKLGNEAQAAKDMHSEKALDYFGAIAKAVKDSNYNPEVAGTMLAHAAANGYGKEAEQFQQQINQNPAALKDLVDRTLAMSPKQAEAQKFRSQASESDVKTALDQIKLKMAQGAKPGDFDQLIDKVAPSPAMGDYLKQRVNFSLQRGDIEGAQKVVDQFAGQAGQTQQDIARETNPQVMAAKTQQAVASAVATEVARQKLNPAAVSGVAPNLVPAATAAFDKAGQEYATANQASQNMTDFLNEAKAGNKEAVKIVPLQGALEITTAQGVHRINRTEVDQFGGAGSLYDKLAGKVGGVLTGKSIDDSVLNAMASLQDTVAKNAKQLHADKVKTINKTYGAKFEPMDFSNTTSSTSSTVAPETRTYLGATYEKQPDGSWKKK